MNCDHEHLDMYGLVTDDMENESNIPMKYHFPAATLSQLEVFGDLDFAVIGLKDNKLQVMPLIDDYSVIPSPSNHPQVTLQESFDMASKLGTRGKQTVDKAVTSIHYCQK